MSRLNSPLTQLIASCKYVISYCIALEVLPSTCRLYFELCVLQAVRFLEEYHLRDEEDEKLQQQVCRVVKHGNGDILLFMCSFVLFICSSVANALSIGNRQTNQKNMQRNIGFEAMIRTYHPSCMTVIATLNNNEQKQNGNWKWNRCVNQNRNRKESL